MYLNLTNTIIKSIIYFKLTIWCHQRLPAGNPQSEDMLMRIDTKEVALQLIIPLPSGNTLWIDSSGILTHD